MNQDHIRTAAEWISQADAVLIGLGAGMGVDSGLPSFRGTEGLWNAYPPLRERGLDFATLANPQWFKHDPQLAWGFYGHRLQQYRSAQPHIGYTILGDWCNRRAHAIMTSNVDGQCQQAGFSNVWEIHGSIHALQCSAPCCPQIWKADQYHPDVDLSTLNEKGDMPHCPQCAALARPNILMFDDSTWVSNYSRQQEQWHDAWIHRYQQRSLVIIECGAGTAIPSVRLHSEWVAAETNARLIRINPSDPQVPRPDKHQIGIAAGAAEALKEIDNHMLAWG